MDFEEPRDGDGRHLAVAQVPLFDVDGDIYAVGGISTTSGSRVREEPPCGAPRRRPSAANRAKSEFL